MKRGLYLFSNSRFILRFVFANDIHHSHLGQFLGILQQLGGDFFIYVCLSATRTNTRRHMINHEPDFPAFKVDGCKSVDKFSLPANEADHELKPVNHEVHKGTQRFLSFLMVFLCDTLSPLWLSLFTFDS